MNVFDLKMCGRSENGKSNVPQTILISYLNQTCHSPGETNLNEYEKKSASGKKNLNDIAESLPRPPPLSYQRRMKGIHQEERNALLHDIEV